MVSFALLGLFVIQILNNVAFARRSFRVPAPPFPNITNFVNFTNLANFTDKFDANVQCIPFEDPHCCVDFPVCECRNGTFFNVNPRRLNGTDLFCVPPGNVTFGQDTSSIPGWCC
ncbi:uncharacterized protein F4807DRAFT_397849 [Annulohypoxylon truncatum]|uniref:uncharacterized protein n=1 Tax=Annulohypoxylon truncatum TaxID=327061 RepID=UPI002007F6E7|nr:uncharacterized protein F4807DRAFT_397849 [Annulohypoxylon truncatum]KAI1211660.1 hypothetical protein F4807DRAFT_397849 [Annulohypoxylon truncatum]